MAIRQKPNNLKGFGVKSVGDAQVAHVEDLQGLDKVDDPDLSQDAVLDQINEDGVEEEENDDPVLVRTGVHHAIINGHILDDGTVTKMKPSDIRNHRERGVALHDVPDDYEGEFYDTSEPYAVPSEEETVE